jgi:hypothetical protein
MVKGGTENYYQYNVGTGGVYKWDAKQEKMVPWDKEAEVVEAGGNSGEASAAGRGTYGGKLVLVFVQGIDVSVATE